MILLADIAGGTGAPARQPEPGATLFSSPERRHAEVFPTLKKEATRPPGMNAPRQQDRFDALVSAFNAERPHAALDRKTPAEVCTPASRPGQGLPERTCPFHDRDIMVTACGRIRMHREKIDVAIVPAGQRPGIGEVEDGIGLIGFMHCDPGYIDLEQRTLRTIDNPFGTRLSPMSLSVFDNNQGRSSPVI